MGYELTCLSTFLAKITECLNTTDKAKCFKFCKAWYMHVSQTVWFQSRIFKAVNPDGGLRCQASTT